MRFPNMKIFSEMLTDQYTRSTKDPGQKPFTYNAGVQQVIVGWDQVCVDVCVCLCLPLSLSLCVSVCMSYIYVA